MKLLTMNIIEKPVDFRPGWGHMNYSSSILQREAGHLSRQGRAKRAQMRTCCVLLLIDHDQFWSISSRRQYEDQSPRWRSSTWNICRGWIRDGLSGIGKGNQNVQ